MLENAIKREHLFSEFETTDELLDSSSPGRFTATNSNCLTTITMLPWVPLTTAAVALRVLEFDAAIFYVLQQKLESQTERGSGNVIVSNILPSQKVLDHKTGKHMIQSRSFNVICSFLLAINYACFH